MDIKNLKFSAEEIDSLLNKIKNLDLSNIEANANIDLAIGTVETVDSINKASASIVRNGDTYKLNLAIPKGAKGNDGEAPTFIIGTVSTGSTPQVIMTGDFPNYILNFVLPSGGSSGGGGGELYSLSIASSSFALNSENGFYEYSFVNPYETTSVVCSLVDSNGDYLLNSINVTDTNIKVSLATPTDVVINVVGGNINETLINNGSGSLTSEQLRLLSVVQTYENNIKDVGTIKTNVNNLTNNKFDEVTLTDYRLDFKANGVNKASVTLPRATSTEELEQINSKLDDITNKAKVILTPSMFGAKGDDITDDYNALRDMFNFRDNVEIFFPKDKIYRVSRGIEIERQNITVYGNNSTIKFTDNSNVLQDIYERKTTTTIASTLLFIHNCDNFKCYNLNLDGNADNVYFRHNGEIYYGYQQDLNIAGIPKQYICTYGIHGDGSNNVYIENCTIKHIGCPINLGGAWGSGDIRKNITVKNVEIEDCFRDGLVIYECEGFLLENIKVTNGQRKGIQCYRNAHNGKIINPKIYNNENTIRRWYPTWDKNNTDAELSGIAIQNPNYTDSCSNILIINPDINVYKNGISVRNYCENITIESGAIKSRTKACINHTGVIDFKIKDISLTGKNGIENNYPTISKSIENTVSNVIYDNVNIISDLGLFYNVSNDCPLTKINEVGNDIDFECNTNFASNINTKEIVKLKTNSLPSQIKNGVVIVNPYENKNVKIVYPTKLLYKSGTTKQYIKFATFSIGELNKCISVKGSITKLSGNSVVGFDYKLMVRSHYEDLSKGIISDLVLSNNIKATGLGIGCVKTYDSALNIERIDVYLISSVSGNYVIDTEVYDYDNCYEYEVIASNDTWQTDVTPDIEKINE